MGAGVLEWGRPPRLQSHEEWASYQADSAPPGTWQPNMDDDWKLKWKAKLLGQKSDKLRVEIRKSTDVTHAGSVQLVLVVFEDGGVVMSANGRAGFSRNDWWELTTAVGEALSAIELWRAQQAGASLSPKYAAIATAAGASGE
jgi:hypothetical protein